MSLRLSDKRALAASFTVALVLRLLFVFVAFPHLQARMHLREDGDGYWGIAQTIRAGTYDDISRSPLYPAFLAAVNSPVGVRVIQCVLDALVCWLVAWLATVLTDGTHPYPLRRRGTPDAPLLGGARGGLADSSGVRAGVYAAWLWAVYPFAIWRTAFFNKEALLPFLLAGYLAVQVRALRGRGWLGWIVAGLALAVLAYGKTVFLLWPAVLLLILAWNRRLTIHVFALGVALAAAVLPWTVRNYRVTGGAFLPIATEYGGMGAFVGNYRPSAGRWEGPHRALWEQALADIDRQHPRASHLELNHARYVAAWRHIWEDPLAATVLVVRKMGRFWFISQAYRIPWATVAIQLVYLGLGGCGWWLVRRQTWLPQLWFGLIAYTMLVYALTNANLRFSVDVMPLVCALGGVGVGWIRSGVAAPIGLGRPLSSSAGFETQTKACGYGPEDT